MRGRRKEGRKEGEKERKKEEGNYNKKKQI